MTRTNTAACATALAGTGAVAQTELSNVVSRRRQRGRKPDHQTRRGRLQKREPVRLVRDHRELPQESYNDSVVAAALAGNLPCNPRRGRPRMPNWGVVGLTCRPLPLNESLIADFLPGTKG